MKVLWTPAAVRHLADIYESIAHDSTRYAKRMVDRITAKSKLVAIFPESGAIVAEYGDPAIREIIEGPYRVIYRAEPHALVVLAVVHGARLLPPELPGGGDA